MKNVRTPIIAFLTVLVVIAIYGCGGGASPFVPPMPDMEALGAQLPTYTPSQGLSGQLWALIAGAGQNDPSKGILVGHVSVANDTENLYVEYTIEEPGWGLNETHVYAGTGPPTTHAPGQFPYKHDALGGAASDEYIIPLADLGVGSGDTLYIAAHATVCPEGEAGFAQGEVATVTLWADQVLDVGSVKVEIDGDNLIVTYQTTGGAQMTQTCLYAGATPPEEPPDPLNFPYKHEGLGGVSTDSYSIPLVDVGAQCEEPLYIAAFAIVNNVPGYEDPGVERQAWGEGELIGECWWAMYFEVNITCEGGETECETAWAYGDHELPGQAWGWYFEYTVQ